MAEPVCDAGLRRGHLPASTAVRKSSTARLNLSACSTLKPCEPSTNVDSVAPGIALSAVGFGLLHLPQYGYTWQHGILITLAGEAASEHRLRRGVGVDVGCVEGGDARVQRGLDAGLGLILFDLGAVGNPVSIRDLTDVQATAAEATKLHGVSLV